MHDRKVCAWDLRGACRSLRIIMQRKSESRVICLTSIAQFMPRRLIREEPNTLCRPCHPLVAACSPDPQPCETQPRVKVLRVHHLAACLWNRQAPSLGGGRTTAWLRASCFATICRKATFELLEAITIHDRSLHKHVRHDAHESRCLLPFMTYSDRSTNDSSHLRFPVVCPGHR